MESWNEEVNEKGGAAKHRVEHDYTRKQHKVTEWTVQSHCCCSICSTKQQSVVNAVFASQFGTVSGNFQKTGQKLLNNVNSSPLAPFNVTSFRFYWTLIFWPLIKLNATELIINSSWLDLSLIQMDCQRWLALQREANEREGKKESNKANNKNKKNRYKT